MIKKAIVLTAAIFLFASIVLLSQNTAIIAVSEVKDKTIVYSERVEPGYTFMVKWIHSVELEPWEEYFTIGNDMEIYLEQTRFKAFGAGVPDSAGTTTEVKDGYISFSGIHTRMSNLVYGISPTAEHTLVVNGETVPLYAMLPPDTAVSFKVEKIRLWKYYFDFRR